MKYYYVHIWYQIGESHTLYYERALYDHEYTGGSENAIQMIEYNLKENHKNENIHIRRVEVETLNVNYTYV